MDESREEKTSRFSSSSSTLETELGLKTIFGTETERKKYILMKDINGNYYYGEHVERKNIEETYKYGEMHGFIFPSLHGINEYNESKFSSHFLQTFNLHQQQKTYNLDYLYHIESYQSKPQTNQQNQYYQDQYYQEQNQSYKNVLNESHYGFPNELKKADENGTQWDRQDQMIPNVMNAINSDSFKTENEYDVRNFSFNIDPIRVTIREQETAMIDEINKKLYESPYFRLYISDMMHMTKHISDSFTCLLKSLYTYRNYITRKFILLQPQEYGLREEIITRMRQYEEKFNMTHYMILLKTKNNDTQLNDKEMNDKQTNEDEAYGKSIYDVYKKVWSDEKINQWVYMQFSKSFSGYLSYIIPQHGHGLNYFNHNSPDLFTIIIKKIDDNIKKVCINMYKVYMEYFSKINVWNDMVKKYIDIVSNMKYYIVIRSPDTKESKNIMMEYDNIIRTIERAREYNEDTSKRIKDLYKNHNIDSTKRYYYKDNNNRNRLCDIDPLM